MNESVKTTSFVGVAAVIALLAFLTQPRPITTPTNNAVASTDELFPDFKDPLDAKGLEIATYDEKLGELSNFKVVESRDGRWVIPSRFDYPADAQNQLRDAATSLIGLKSLGLHTEQTDEHALCGVLEPNKDKLKLGDEGVGTLIRILGSDGKYLAQLIIGKKVKIAKSDNTELRFVRIPSQHRVYVAKIGLEKFSTNFENWIEKDLLKLNAFDVERIGLRDHSISKTNRGAVLEMRMEAGVRFADNKWELEELTTYKNNKKQTTELLESEELNTAKLDGLKKALDELKIVDVRRKPKGLATDLRADESLAKDVESQRSLAEKGFYLHNNDILSANGEVSIGMKDGYEYVLRFGDVASADDEKLNRYLFVTARFDEKKFPEPAYEPLPQGPVQDSPKKEEEKNGDGAGDDAPAKDAKAPADKPAAEKPATDKPAAEKSEKPASDSASPAKEEPKKDDGKKEEEFKKLEYDRIRKENERKKNDWQEKKQKAINQVLELNARFADWYYVISEDTYKEIHLERADIIKEKAVSKDEGFGPDAFRKLETDGLMKPAAPPSPPGPPGRPGGR